MLDPKCPFCRIVEGTEPSDVWFRNPWAVAFSPLEPAALGHTLVVPTQHLPTFFDLESSPSKRDFMDTLLAVASLAQVRVGAPAMNLIVSAGREASQSVFHLHWHVVPRFEGDHLGPHWPWY